MKTLIYPALEEQMQTTVLDNGLRIFGIPRPNSAKNFAMLAADFGSIDCSFTLDDIKYDVTPGIAHFLEHKMFEDKDGNALQKFTANGAQPNAFTSHTMTAYHFTCTDQFYDNLEILLKFVTTPYFTDENVKKEKGIIGQEIGMLDDTPSWQAYVSVLAGLYAVHPVRISVAGTKETIAPIDPAILNICHRAFYSPANLALTVCGQYDFDRVVRMAQELMPKESAHIAAREYGIEPEQAALPYLEKKMAVSRPMFMLGCKDSPAEDNYRRQLVGELAVNCVAGKSTALYDALYQQGLADSSFDSDYFTFPQGACAIFSGETSDPKRVAQMLNDEMKHIVSEGLPQDVFERTKKAAYGRYIRRSNDSGEMCRLQTEACFSNANYFDFAEVLHDITLEETEQRIRQFAKDGMSCLAVIAPQEAAK